MHRPSATELASHFFFDSTAGSSDSLPLKTFSLRLDLETTSWVENIAVEARESRQTVLACLVSLGLSELLDATPPDVRDRIQEAVFVDLNSQE